MRVGPRLALLCTLLLAAAVPLVVVGQPAAATAAVGTPAAATAPAVSPTPASTAPAVQSSNVTVPAESTTMAIQLQRDGDARWTVTTEFRLENESDRQAFEQLAASFETGNGGGAAYDVRTFERAAAQGRNATGREMRVEAVQYNATTNATSNATTGRLTLSFRWTNFTESGGDSLVLGDAFNGTSGTWLPGLTTRQTLVVRPPPGYSVDTAPVPVRNGVLRWEGPATFEPGYLGQITYERTGPGPSSPGGPGETPTPGGIDLSTLGLVGVLVVGLGALAIGAYYLSRREADEPTPTPEPNANGGVDEVVAGGGAATTGAADGESAAADDPDEDEPDFELLSDEERVEYLLEQNGGRMKQANIVKETGWSNAKVSQLLSAMDDDDRIDKLRIGRENLISLPDEDPSEFDER